MKKYLIFLVSIFLDRLPILRRCKDWLLIEYYKLCYCIKKRNITVFNDSLIVPVSIIYNQLNEIVPVGTSLGLSKPGDWDLNISNIEDTDIYISIKARILNGSNWEITPFYQRVLAEILSGSIKWGCKSEDDLITRFSEVDDLINSIKCHGVRSVADRKDDNSRVKFFDDILVCIDRDGHFILHDGRHRLIIAKVLGHNVVPVRVTFRHKDWVDFATTISAYSEHHSKLYAPLLHNDLQSFTSNHGHERFEIILENMPIKKGSVLDIGSHWGYFCHRFEDLGFSCTALEPDIKNLFFLNKLKIADNKSFSVIPKGVFDIDPEKHFDIILALYVFHHFLKTESNFLKLKKYLQCLSANYMFFASHSNGEPQMKGSFCDMSADDFTAFIIDNSRFTNKKIIWEDAGGRRLYLLD